MDTNFTNLNNNKLETFTLAGNVSGSLASNVLTINLNAVQTSITQVGTLASLSVSGNVSTGNVSGTLITGTLSTASQPNVTSVGTLSSITTTGVLSGAELRNFKETTANLTYAATITPNVANASVQTVTLTGNVTFSQFENPQAGQTLLLILKQDSTGSRILTSNMKFAGNSRTLTTTANAVDIISAVYSNDGTYYASLNKGFL